MSEPFGKSDALFGDIEESPERPLVDAGVYDVEIADVEEGFSKAKGERYWRLTYRITDGKFKDAPLVDYRTLSWSEKNAGNAKRDLRTLMAMAGEPLPANIQLGWTELLAHCAQYLKRIRGLRLKVVQNEDPVYGIQAKADRLYMGKQAEEAASNGAGNGATPRPAAKTSKATNPF